MLIKCKSKSLNAIEFMVSWFLSIDILNVEEEMGFSLSSFLTVEQRGKFPLHVKVHAGKSVLLCGKEWSPRWWFTLSVAHLFSEIQNIYITLRIPEPFLALQSLSTAEKAFFLLLHYRLCRLTVTFRSFKKNTPIPYAFREKRNPWYVNKTFP